MKPPVFAFYWCSFFGVVRYFVVQRVGLFIRRIRLLLLKNGLFVFFIVMTKVCSRDKKSFISR